MEDNGKSSSRKHTKHINVIYVFITDRIKNVDMSVELGPIGEMNGYFLTKPNQGYIFKIFRDHIMGFIPKQTQVTENRAT